ncbi:MAG: biotin--[acetyl-CoA-carboxylase] ligase [Chloroflexi bacterium]|nr:biotin--[acetyl-CoA-carboxylase] ligase [Chloroflexota bacterium]
MDQHTLETNLAGLPLGRIRFYDNVGSTNDIASDWADEGAPDLSLVLANGQTAGRGRAGRKWFTQPGASLAFSLILRPPISKTPPPHPSTKSPVDYSSIIPRLSGLGALGVSRALRKHYSLPAQIKWPNDVLVKQRKLAGVLAEAHWTGNQLSAAILGIGINIAASSVPLDDVLAFPATSVESALGCSVDRLSLLRSVISEVISCRSLLAAPEFIQAWEADLAFRGEQVQIVSSGGQGEATHLVHEGYIAGLDSDGSLKLRLLSGEEATVRLGEIRLRLVDSSPK